jgi:hypothetical protein
MDGGLRTHDRHIGRHVRVAAPGAGAPTTAAQPAGTRPSGGGPLNLVVGVIPRRGARADVWDTFALNKDRTVICQRVEILLTGFARAPHF